MFEERNLVTFAASMLILCDSSNCASALYACQLAMSLRIPMLEISVERYSSKSVSPTSRPIVI